MKRFPWRKKWLVGSWLPQTAAQHILAAHCSNTPQASISTATFWEFKDQLHALRNRRIAKYSRKTQYSDVNISRSCLPP
jgi:NADH dehydrogenase [ubiquinone] 1 alpha subcomplex assembly factor 2